MSLNVIFCFINYIADGRKCKQCLTVHVFGLQSNGFVTTVLCFRSLTSSVVATILTHTAAPRTLSTSSVKLNPSGQYHYV